MDESLPGNRAELCGVASGPPVYSHSGRGEDYYSFAIATERLSGAKDIINILVRASLLRCAEIEQGIRLHVTGELRSFNNKSGRGSKLVLNVFARTVEASDMRDLNSVTLDGSLCKSPCFRTTPLGRDICDLMLAVPRRYGRCDYLPCIVWGRDAAEVSVLGPGSRVRLIGRIQSRNYIKCADGLQTVKTAYEVSASSICVL